MEPYTEGYFGGFFGYSARECGLIELNSELMGLNTEIFALAMNECYE